MSRLVTLAVLFFMASLVTSASNVTSVLTPEAHTYYVSPSGSDTAAGTSAAPWKTVSRVNDQEFSPGDTVFFQGGQTFDDDYIEPHNAGTSAAPITYASYGTGQANITQGIHLESDSNLVFNNLSVKGLTWVQGVLATAYGTGSTNITIENSTFENLNIGINLANSNDSNWTISGNTVKTIKDSGLIIEGHDILITGNTITDTGYDTSIPYGKHGIYAKGPHETISYNEFTNNADGQAISLRAHGDLVYGNTIHDTGGIGFFDFDHAASPQGTDYVYNNRLWSIRGWFFYYSGELDGNGNVPSVSFVIANNTVTLPAGEAVLLGAVPSVASVNVVNNVFTGTYDTAYRGCSTCTESHNDWYGAKGWIPSGLGDLTVNPLLSTAPALVPQAGSPLINAGTSNATGLVYLPLCDGVPLHYCGASPDIGAVETLTSATPPTTTTPTTTTPTTTTPTTTTPTTTTPIPPPDKTPPKVSVKRRAKTPPKAPTKRRVNSAVVSRSIVVSTTATDASGIRRVVISLDGRTVCARRSSSASCTMSISSGKHRIVARATDMAGNTASASILVARPHKPQRSSSSA